MWDPSRPYEPPLVLAPAPWPSDSKRYEMSGKVGMASDTPSDLRFATKISVSHLRAPYSSARLMPSSANGETRPTTRARTYLDEDDMSEYICYMGYVGYIDCHRAWIQNLMFPYFVLGFALENGCETVSRYGI